MLIYMVTNRVNGKEYVGQTISSLKQRKQGHITEAKLCRDNSYFHKALRKYGINSFDWEILHDNITNIEDLNKSEIYYIDLYNTFENGYNLTLGGGGNLGCKPSAEARQKMSVAHSGENNYFFGKKHSTKAKQKISKAAFSRILSVEAKQKISEAFSGKNHPNYGKFGKDSSYTKSVIICNMYFNTLKESAEFLGITGPAVRHRILHPTKWLDHSYA